MMMARCLSRGARIFGIISAYDDIEMTDSITLKKGQTIVTDDDGNVDIVNAFDDSNYTVETLETTDKND